MSEKNLNFDAIVDRHNTAALKYDFAEARGHKTSELPLWVADMDFKTSSYIQEALIETARHGIFGYTEVTPEYLAAVAGWQEKRHGWKIRPEWVLRTPGVVFALAAAVQAYTQPGEGVIIQSPVYYPFSEVIEDNGRVLVKSSLIRREDASYTMDLLDFEEKIKTYDVKLFLLCNPHNPVGRVWTREELLALGEICLRNGVTVIADEIHSDFIFQGRHLVFADLSPELAAITVTCTSPSKTFNLAGLQISNIIVSDPELRRRLHKKIQAFGYSQVNTFGLAATQTAYTKGEEWYQALLNYLRDNIHFAKTFLDERLPEIGCREPEGTYLIWLDCRRLGCSVEELETLVCEKAGLWLDSGAIFGKDGEGFQRLNAACPRSVLQEALERLEKAIRG